MKKIILGLGLVAMSSLSALGCDQCGCASSGFMGIVPQFGRHYVGLRYQFQSFETRHHADLNDDGTLKKSSEYFHSMELTGSYYPHPRVQLLATLPFAYRTQKEQAGATYIGYGIGDAWIGGNYTIIATPDSIGKKVRHNLLVGTGLKTPTGANRLQQDGVELHQNLQPGTGSWDVDLNTRYILRIKRWGLSTLVNYRLNTANSDGFKNGDRITGLLGAYYWTKTGEVTLLPQVALNYDQLLSDQKNGRDQMNTGGYQLAARADFQVGFKRFIGSVGYSLPLSSNLSNGEVTPKHQCNFSILFLI